MRPQRSIMSKSIMIESFSYSQVHYEKWLYKNILIYFINIYFQEMFSFLIATRVNSNSRDELNLNRVLIPKISSGNKLVRTGSKYSWSGLWSWFWDGAIVFTCSYFLHANGMNQVVLNEFKAELGARSLPRLRKLWLIWQINGFNTDGGEQLSGYWKSIIQICIQTEE